MMFNVVPVDTMDTSPFALRADSISNTPDTTFVTETDTAEIFPIIMGGISAPSEVMQIDSPVIIKDTIVEPKMMVGEFVIPVHPMVMGKIACTKPNKVSKPTPVDRKTKGEVFISGDVKF